MKHFISAILVIFTTCLLTTTLNAQSPNKDWPQIDGFSERLGYIESSMKPPFKRLSSIATDLNIKDFTYVDGMVYFSTNLISNTFVALDIFNGNTLWQKSLPNTIGSVNFHPAVSDDLVFLGGQRGLGLYAYDRFSGDSVWFQPIKGLYGRNVAIKGENLYVNAPGEGVQCYNKRTGEKKWEFGEYSFQTVPLVDDDHVYHYTADTIFTLNKDDGKIVWKRAYKSNNFSATMIKGDTLFFKTRSKMVTFNAQSGTLIWEKDLGTNNSYLATWNVLTWTPDMLIVHEWNGDWQDSFKIQGYAHEDGTLKWTYSLKPNSICPSAGFGSYVALINGSTLEIRSAANGEVVQSFPQFSFIGRVKIKAVDQFIFVVGPEGLSIFTPESTSTFTEDKISLNWKIIDDPIGSSIHLEFESDQSMEVHYAIVDLNGQLISPPGSLNIKDGITQHDIFPGHLPPGNYFISIWNNSFADSKSFISQSVH